MRTEKHHQAFECARSILTFSDGTSILYKLPKDCFDFFVNIHLPCLLGASNQGETTSWKTTSSDEQKKLPAFLSRVQKLGVACGTFDDIPAIRDDSELFLLYYALFRLKEEEKKGQTVNPGRKSRLQKIDTLLSVSPERIFNGFIKDREISLPKKRKPSKPSSLDPASLEQALKDYFSGEEPPPPPPSKTPPPSNPPPRNPPSPPRNTPPRNMRPRNTQPSDHRGLGFFILFLLLVGIGVSVYYLMTGGLFGKTDKGTPSPEDPSTGQTTNAVTCNTPESDRNGSQGDIRQYYVSAMDFQAVDGLKFDHIHDSSDSDTRFAIFKLNGSTTKILEIGESFKFRDMEWRLVGIEPNRRIQEEIAYLELPGKYERIACLPNRTVSLPGKVVLRNEQTGTTISTAAGSTFKLTSESGEVEYKVVSVDPVSWQVVVESSSGKYTLAQKKPAEDSGTPPAKQQTDANRDNGNGSEKADPDVEARERAMQQRAEEERRAAQQAGKDQRDSAGSAAGIGPNTPDRNGASGSSGSDAEKDVRGNAGGNTGGTPAASESNSGTRQETAQTNPPEDADNSQDLAKQEFRLGLKEILERDSKIAVDSINIESVPGTADGSMVVLPFDEDHPFPSNRKNNLRNDSFTMDVQQLFSTQILSTFAESLLGKDKTKIMSSEDDDYEKIDRILADGSKTDVLAGTLNQIKNGQYAVCRYVVGLDIKSYHEEHTFKNYQTSGTTEFMIFSVRIEMKLDMEVFDRASGETHTSELTVKTAEKSYRGDMKPRYSDHANKKDWTSADFINDRSPFFEDIGKALHDYLTTQLPETAQAEQPPRTESAQGTGAGSGTAKPMDSATKQKLDTLQYEFVQSINREMEKQGKVAINSIKPETDPIPATGYALSMSNRRSGARQDVKSVSFTPALPGAAPDSRGDLCAIIGQAAVDKPGTGSNRSTAAPRVMDPANDAYDELCEIYDSEEAVDVLDSTRRKIESSQYAICRYDVAVTVKAYEEQHVFKEFAVGKMDFVVRSKITLDLEVYDRSGHSRRSIRSLKLTSSDFPHSIGTQRSLTDYTPAGNISTDNVAIDRKPIFEDFGKKLNTYLRSNTFIQALRP